MGCFFGINEYPGYIIIHSELEADLTMLKFYNLLFLLDAIDLSIY